MRRTTSTRNVDMMPPSQADLHTSRSLENSNRLNKYQMVLLRKTISEKVIAARRKILKDEEEEVGCLTRNGIFSRRTNRFRVHHRIKSQME